MPAKSFRLVSPQRTDSLTGPPRRFPSWVSTDEALEYYATHHAGEHVTKWTLGGTPKVAHVRAMLGAFDLVARDGEARSEFFKLLAGRCDPVLFALRDRVPHLIHLIENRGDVDEVAQTLDLLGADRHFRPFLFETLHRSGIDVEAYAGIRLSSQNPQRRIVKAAGSGMKPGALLADESAQARLTVLQAGLRDARSKADLKGVQSYNEMIDQLEDKLRAFGES
jgi:hypothetical protein